MHSLLAQQHAQAAHPATMPRAPRTLACAPLCARAVSLAQHPSARTPACPCAREPVPPARLAPVLCRAPTRVPAAHPCAPSSQPSLMLKWAVAHFSVCPIFFSSSHWKMPTKIFTYFLSFSSTPINLLKFISSILFIFSHFPTNQINCLNLFYLFSCSSLHIVNSKVCFPTCLCAIYISTQTFTSYIHDHTTFHQITKNIPNTCMPCPSFHSHYSPILQM